MKNVIKAVAGGFMIGVGGAVYLACDVKYIGAFLFALGLLTICEFGLGLYTGKVGYTFINKGNFYIEVLQTLLGNVFGTAVAGLLIYISRSDLSEKAAELGVKKLMQSPLQTLILSFFCGILMFIAVNLYKKREGIGKYIGIFTAVPVFILSGFEHSIANMFYFFSGWAISVQSALYILICVVGNALGAFAIAYFDN